MPCIDCTFVSDGSADAALVPFIKWVLERFAGDRVAEVTWADLSRVRRRPTTLVDKIVESVRLYPCDILCVHRDAEAQPYECRVREIAEAIGLAGQQGIRAPHVCLIPVRMQEAWLLLDVSAIRRAAGNPNGSVQLSLPAANRIERTPDPKQLLYSLLRMASELSGRRLCAFQPGRCALLVPAFMGDVGVLRQLPAFQRFEADVQASMAVVLEGVE